MLPGGTIVDNGLQIDKDPSEAQETDETVTRRWRLCGLRLWGFQEGHSCNQGAGPCVED